MKRQYSSIFSVYILLGLALGLWEVFKPIWLMERGISIDQLGITFFIALLLAALFSLLINKKVMKYGIRKCIQLAILCRFLTFLFMLLSNNKSIMILLSCFDLLVDTLIIQWMYPLLTQIKISNKLFGLKDNLYDLAGNVGTIIAGVLIGITLYQFTSYQVCILVCLLIFVICFFSLFLVKNEKIQLENKNLSKEIFQIKSAKDYIKYSCSRRLQLFLILGFFMVLLTEKLGLDKSFAGISWSILQIVFNFVGVIFSIYGNKINRVRFFKFSNISSIIILFIAGITKNVITAFIAILWIDVLSDFYSPVIDAPLTNEIPKHLQLYFASFNHIISYIGRGCAYIISGFLIHYNYRMIFLISIVFLAYQNLVGVRALKNCVNTNVYGEKDVTHRNAI